MNILFLTLTKFESIDEHNIYTDLLSVFVKNNHKVYAISPLQRQHGKNTHINVNGNITIYRPLIGNITGVGVLEKGLSTLTLEGTIIKYIKENLDNIKFDLILYSTPPITFYRAIRYVKERDNAKSYLLLKDIFPQNAVDIGLIKKGFLYSYFREKEKKLYEISDKIGCMSNANVTYLCSHNKQLDKSKVSVCPNSILVEDKSVNTKERVRIRKKYNIPLDKKVFVYGGNLGKPQDINYIVDCLRECRDLLDVFFLIVGSGTEYNILEKYKENSNQGNFKLMNRLPKDDYENMIGACDVGLLFLDHRFTIPNFPSRLLSYMGAKLPVLACTDRNTDIGEVITDGGFGWWCESNDKKLFKKKILQIQQDNANDYGQKAFDYLKKYYSVEVAYEIIMDQIAMR